MKDFFALRGYFAALALNLCVTSITLAQLPATQLTSIFPPGGKPGTAVEVTIAGLDQDDASKLVFSHPGIVGVAKMTMATDLEKVAKPVAGAFTVNIAADVPPGVYEVRTVGRFGQSNARIFTVSALNELIDAGTNAAPDKAVDVPVGSVFSGRVDANTYDHLKVPLKAGERVIIDCSAERIQSRLNATLVLMSPAGKELVRAKDTVGNDPVLDFTAPAEGFYVLKVFDNVYGGGPDYLYRLSVTPSAYVDFVFPPSAPAGSNNQFTVYGRNLPGGAPADGLTINGAPLQKLVVNIPMPADEVAKTTLASNSTTPVRGAWQDGIEFRLPTPAGPANPVTVYFARGPVIVETEPNDLPAQAQKITLPCEYIGQFYPQRDVDWVQFDAKKGTAWYIEVASHQLGLESDPFFALYRVTKNEKGEEVVADITQVDDTQERQAKIGTDFDTSTDDPSFKFTVPEDGTYRLFLRDQVGSGRKNPSFVYRLMIHAAEPDFRMLAQAIVPGNPQQNQNTPLLPSVVRKGGTTAVGVLIDRRDDFTGDIAITVEGLPAGVTCPGAVVGGDVNTAVLVFSAAEGAAAAAGPIKIVGKAQIAGKEVVRESRYAQIVWGTANRQTQNPEFQLTRSFQLAVIDKEMQPAFVQIGEDKIWETSLGGNIEIPVTATRRGDWKEPLKLVATGLPQEIKPKEINLDPNTAAGKFELAINQANIKPGVYTFYMRADTKQKHIRNPEAQAGLEAEQKVLDETIKALGEVVKTATTAKDAATKEATDTKAAATTAEQAKNNAVNVAKQKADAAKVAADNLAKAKEAAAKDAANQGLKDAQAAAQKASDDAAVAAKAAADEQVKAEKVLADALALAKTKEDARVASEAALKAATDKVTAANQFKPQFDARVNAIKQANQPKDVNFSLISTPIKLRIVATPIAFTSAAVGGAVKQGEKQTLTANINRLYAFADAVEISFEPPAGVQGLTANKVSIPNGQAEGKLEIVAAANATPGDHNVVVRAKGKFNNVDVTTVTNVVVKVEEVKK
jgi:hypothetical protein